VAAMSEPRMSASAAVHNGRVYVLGGASSASLTRIHATVVSWAPGESGWRTERPLAQARHSAAACAYQGAIVVSGGSTSGAPDAQGESGDVLLYYP
jgi:hypothetical protein